MAPRPFVTHSGGVSQLPPEHVRHPGQSGCEGMEVVDAVGLNLRPLPGERFHVLESPRVAAAELFFSRLLHCHGVTAK